jgi:hypothetical protein
MAEAFPGGFVKGGEAFYVAHSQTTANGMVLKYGTKGVVLSSPDETSIAVKFGDIGLKCLMHQVALTQPSLEFAGGFKLDDEVFFKGPTSKVGNVSLEQGCKGMIVGPGNDESVAVKWEALQAPIKVKIDQLCKNDPDGKPPDGVPLGFYYAKGDVDGRECTYQLTLNDKKLFWLDYKLNARVATAPPEEQFHAEGRFDIAEDKLKLTFGGLPGQARQGLIWDFDVVVNAPFKNLSRDGLTLKPQGNVEVPTEKPKEKEAKPEPKVATTPAATTPPKVETKVATTPAPSAAVPPPKEETKVAPTPGEELTVDQLKDEQVCKAKGVDPAMKETYLSDADFETLFKMPKTEFAALPKWKKETAKKKHGLF